MTTQSVLSPVRHRRPGRGLIPTALVAVVMAVLWVVQDSPIWIAAVLVAGLAALTASGVAEWRARHGVEASAWSGQAARYRRLLAGRLDRVELAGTRDGEPAVRLRDVFVDVAVTHDDAPQTYRPVIGAARRADRRRGFAALLRKRRTGSIVLLSETGGGKTTVARRVALELAGRRTGKRRIPILLTIPDHLDALTGPNPPPLSAIAARTGWLAGQIRPGWFHRQLVTGRCVVFCDGIDEIADEADRRRVLDWWKTQAKQLRRNTFVLASRPASWPGAAPSGPGTWRLGELSSAQMAGFCYAWCAAVENRKTGHTASWVRDESAAEAGVLLSRLRAKPALHDLLTNPLRLTLVALVHRHCGILPTGQNGLYSDALDLMLSRDPRCRPETFRRLARYLTEHRTTRLTPDDARRALPGEPVDDVLAAGVAAGLLVSTTHGHAFSHTGIRHYLTAMSLLDDSDDAAVTAKASDPWWRETLLLWAAHTDVTRVVESCLRTGEMTALAAAFDMAECAAGLAAGLRTELRELLTLATETQDENRVISAVKVHREMRDMLRLYGGARLTSVPVSNGLYTCFLDTEYPGGRHRRHSDPDSAPAVGVWPGDAVRFVEWINRLPRNDDTTYWLPTESELVEPAYDPRASTLGAGVWVHSPDGPRLFHRHRAKDPYTVGHGWWDRAADADRRRATLLLYQLSIVLGPMSRSLSRDLAGEINLERGIAYDLPRVLKRDNELVASRRYLRRDLAPPGRDLTDSRGREHLDRIIEQVTELAAKPLDFRADPAQSESDNLPFAFLEQLSPEWRRMLATGYTMLWFACRPGEADGEYGAALRKLDSYLRDGIPEAGTNGSQTVTPSQLVEALRQSYQSMKDYARGGVWRGLASELLSEVVDRLSSTLTHSRSYDVDDIVGGRAVLRAILAVLREQSYSGRGDRRQLRPLVERLSTVIAGLTVLEDRATGRIEPSEVIMLVRK